MGDYGNSTRRCTLCAALIRNTAKTGDAHAARAPGKNTPRNQAAAADRAPTNNAGTASTAAAADHASAHNAGTASTAAMGYRAPTNNALWGRAALRKYAPATNDGLNADHLSHGLGSSAALLLAGSARGGNKQLFYPYKGIAVNANLVSKTTANNKQSITLAAGQFSAGSKHRAILNSPAAAVRQLNQLVANSKVSLMTSLLPVVLLWSLLLL